MTSPFSSYFDTSALVAGDSDIIARPITVLSGAQLASGAIVAGVTTTAATTVLPRGTLLGRVTASGKYIVSVSTAVDGSQTPACITAFDVDPTLGDVATSAYFIGEFAFEKMTYDASWTAATIEAAARIANNQIIIRSLGALG